jgi:hypothetical protein
MTASQKQGGGSFMLRYAVKKRKLGAIKYNWGYAKEAKNNT